MSSMTNEGWTFGEQKLIGLWFFYVSEEAITVWEDNNNHLSKIGCSFYDHKFRGPAFLISRAGSSIKQIICFSPTDLLQGVPKSSMHL